MCHSGTSSGNCMLHLSLSIKVPVLWIFQAHRQVGNNIDVGGGAVVHTAISRWQEGAGRPSEVRHVFYWYDQSLSSTGQPPTAICYSSWSLRSETLKRGKTFGEPRKYSVTDTFLAEFTTLIHVTLFRSPYSYSYSVLDIRILSTQNSSITLCSNVNDATFSTENQHWTFFNSQ